MVAAAMAPSPESQETPMPVGGQKSQNKQGARFSTFIMTKSYAQLVKQIATLQAEAEKVRRGEIDGVIARIREAIQFYNLTAADLGLSTKPASGEAKATKAPKRRKAKGTKAPKPAGVVKYSNGAGGTWGGRGKRPQWLRDALAAGKQLSDFEVK